MAEPLHIYWDGKSGKEYRHWIYKMGTEFPLGPANYVFAKEVEPHHWRPIYIGETGDLSERFDNHHKMPCIRRNEATHLHAHKSSEDKEVRCAEEADLIANYNPICND